MIIYDLIFSFQYPLIIIFHHQSAFVCTPEVHLLRWTSWESHVLKEDSHNDMISIIHRTWYYKICIFWTFCNSANRF